MHPSFVCERSWRTKGVRIFKKNCLWNFMKNGKFSHKKWRYSFLGRFGITRELQIIFLNRILIKTSKHVSCSPFQIQVEVFRHFHHQKSFHKNETSPCQNIVHVRWVAIMRWMKSEILNDISLKLIDWEHIIAFKPIIWGLIIGHGVTRIRTNA